MIVRTESTVRSSVGTREELTTWKHHIAVVWVGFDGDKPHHHFVAIIDIGRWLLRRRVTNDEPGCSNSWSAWSR